MLNHVSIGVKDLLTSRRFYEAALDPLGYKCVFESTEYACYGTTSPEFCVVASPHPVPPDQESGLHFCFGAARRSEVDGFHRMALAAGGRDNGAPGLRKEYGNDYYAAFVIDPDGYRLEAYTTSPT